MIKKIKENFGKMLCLLGIHDFEMIEMKFGFGAAGNIEVVECKRCGHKTTRRSR